jgi:5-methylcytosine-specific restriction endonuclease McrA
MSKRGTMKQRQRRKNNCRRRWARSDGSLVCHWCRGILPPQKGSWTIDHIIPLSAGGTNDDTNLVPCCASCNKARDSIHRRTGLVVCDPVKIKEQQP